jgi:lysophospholipase L1-like esterase
MNDLTLKDLKKIAPGDRAIQIVWMLVITVLFSACAVLHQDTGGSRISRETPYRILAVGDSITAGYTDNPSWRVPFEFGFRGPLLGMLQSNGIPVQFVGSSAEPWNGLWKVPTNQPVPDLRQLGQDYHEGYGGKGTAFVAQHIASWIENTKPDFVLLMIGINDIAAGSTNAPEATRSNLQSILQTVITLRPEAYVIVAQTTPYTRATPAIVDLNRFIRETLVPEFAARGARISTVDQFANFVSEPGVSTGDRALYSNGYNHPNTEGYRRMAQTWFNEIQRLLQTRATEIKSSSSKRGK